eukprot:scaffold198690_cov12-Tisochrysis_lutea.AAC.1
MSKGEGAASANCGTVLPKKYTGVSCLINTGEELLADKRRQTWSRELQQEGAALNTLFQIIMRAAFGCGVLCRSGGAALLHMYIILAQGPS